MSTEGGQEPFRSAKTAPRARVLLVTGMSGAGRSTALKILEDMGYESFDNLPASLIPALVESTAADRPSIAVGADTRTRGFAAATMLDNLANAVGRHGRELRVLFVDCDDERLERRYTETRRPHPLAGDRPIMDGIRRERQVVFPLRDHADLVIDTSALTATDLKRLLTGHFALDARGLRVFVTSFAYRHGVPRDADLVFDVRFLENPHYVDELRRLTGCDPAVAAHIEGGRGFRPVFRRPVAPGAPAVAALRNERQDLSDDRDRLHRRPPSFGLCRRAARGPVARGRMANRAGAPRSAAARRRSAGSGRRGCRRGLSRSRPSRGNR